MPEGRSAVHVQPHAVTSEKADGKAQIFTEAAIIAGLAIPLILQQAIDIKRALDFPLALIGGVEMFLFGHAVGAPVIDQRIELVLPVDVFLRELKPGRHAHALAVAAAGGRAKPPLPRPPLPEAPRSEEHTSELQSLMRISYAVFCLTKKTEQLPYSTNETKARILIQLHT